MRLRQLTGFFRLLPGGALRREFIRITKHCTRLTSWILRSRRCCGAYYCKEWSLYVVLTRQSAICWIYVLLDILISCSSPAFGNSVTIFLPMMLRTSCLPRDSGLL